MAARDFTYVLVAIGCLVAALFTLWVAAATDTIGFDFRGTMWDPAMAIRDGRTPFPNPLVADVDVGNPALYPPLLPILAIPITALSWSTGLILWTSLLVCALGLTLYVLNVRDPRCYALALVSAPVAGDLVIGNATLLLLPMVALAWRWRDSWLRCGIVLGLAIAGKLFLWPLTLWLIGTRRYRAGAAAAVATAFWLVIPWAFLGFDGFASYSELLRVGSEVFAVHSYSVAAILSALGVELDTALRGVVLVALLLGALAVLAGRRGSDTASFSIALTGAILGSPIVWIYNFAFVLIPLAIARPRFSGHWVGLAFFYLALGLPHPDLDRSEASPGGSACCRPDDVPWRIWAFSHAPPALWPALGLAGVALVIISTALWSSRRQTSALR